MTTPAPAAAPPEQWQIDAERENTERVEQLARQCRVPTDFAGRLLDVELMCQLTLAYTPSTDTVLAEQRIAISVLQALGLPFDREGYLARLDAARLAAANPTTTETEKTD